jgi:hypothetical protein
MNNITHTYIPKAPFFEEGNAKAFSLSLPFLWKKKISFGVLNQRLATDSRRVLIFIKLSGKLPQKTGDEVRKRMFGLQLIRYDDRIRLGFISRSQTIKKA